MGNRVRQNLGILLLVWLAPLSTTAAADCKPWAARIVSVQGEIEVKQASTSNWHPVKRNDTFCPGDSIRVGNNSRAAIVLLNETLLRLDQNSAIKLTLFETELPSILEFIMGIGYFISRVPRSLKIETATVNAAIEGTEFIVAVSTNETSVTVFEGTVLTQNKLGDVRITNGETVIAKANTAPVKTLLAKPRDTVQWALYFPPIIEIDKLSPLSRASQLLTVGRVKEAQTLLQGMDSGEALALQAIIAIVNNEPERAFKLATDAVQQAPRSAATHIAMSYAWQAKLDLKQALASSQQAVEYEPGNAIAWARLAELQLSTGELDEALASAQQAILQDATLSRTQSILGYAYLARIEIDEAMASFNKAIELDQVDPLPRLGLGLVKIRRGKLADGRRDIEIATSLDPNNAIIRSYLGKAYFEEKRGPLDAEQFAMSKQLDPNDPTPYFYDAIRKQTENNPVGALEDLNRSIELNDNRAVYRSSLQLDQDDAARGASLARIYQDLGFEQLALEEGVKSVNTDPTSHSAHRFLADIYSSRRRHDIARVSELLQSQLLQPININPVQPRLGEANLFALEGAGPADTSFNEFTPLFTRNKVALHVAVVTGSNDTLGDELTVSGIANRLSFSLGQYHFETDGFRENNDVKHDIYNAFVQFTPSPTTSFQAEVRHLETDSGDLRLRFDPDNFLPNERREIERDSFRLGFHHKPSTHGDIIGSLIYIDRQQARTDREILAIPGFSLVSVDSIKTDGDAYSAELQYLHRTDQLNWIVGAGYFDEDLTSILTNVETLTIDPDPPIMQVGIPTVTSEDPQHSNAYLYSNIRLKPSLTLTAGLAYDSYEDFNSDDDRFNPKLGLMWEAPQGTTLRAAWFKTLKRPFALDQTIEPTQVVGFNQFFDDLNGTRTTRYGVALDQRFTRSLFAGAEASWRKLELNAEKQDEQLHRAYLSWAVNKTLSFNAEYLFEDFDIDLRTTSLISDITTRRVPLGVNLYWPNGLIAELRASYVDQEVIENGIPEDDQFWVTDASIGYRLPKRWGIVRLTAKNLFDEQFNYHDINFNTGEPLIPLFQPERQVFAHFTVAF